MFADDMKKSELSQVQAKSHCTRKNKFVLALTSNNKSEMYHMPASAY